MKHYHITKSFSSTTIMICLLFVSPSNAETIAPSLNLNTLNNINANCLEQADKANNNVAIAIYDKGGILLSFIQTDDVAAATGEVARWKARSTAQT